MLDIIISQIFNGISLFSILLLMAIGLSIIFGLMGVINLAHGELMMIGAYITYILQLFFKTHFTSFFPFYIFIALLFSFIITAFIGLFIERSLIQFLYKRPLDTLLATWGLSLILQQCFRNLFGANNVSVEMPKWLTGSLAITHNLVFPTNRIFILFVTLLSTLGVFYFLHKTRWGLKIRATIQNREMSSALGINTKQVDAVTFALGSGLAGIAGCVLTLIGSVGPTTGQNYIVDSFIVVILGGTETLIGTVLSALTIATFRSFFEFLFSSSMGEVLTLLCVILLLQIKPRGLFSIKVRK